MGAEHSRFRIGLSDIIMAEVEPRLVVKILRVADAHIRIAFAADPVHDLQCVKLKIIVRVPEDHIFS